MQLEQLAKSLGLTRAETTECEEEWLRILEARARGNAVISIQGVERIGRLASAVGLKTTLVATERPLAEVPSSGLVCVTSSQIVDGVKWSFENLKPLIEALGCEATNTMSKRNPPALLLCPDVNGGSKKSEAAKEWGIPMMPISEFLAKVSST